MDVRHLCSSGVISAPEEACLAEVAQLMHDRHVGSVVIVAEQAGRSVAVGIITDRDIMRAQLHHAVDLSALAASQIMTRDLLLLGEHTGVDEAIDRMAMRGVRRAPVINVHGELVGLISIDEMIRQVARELGALSRLLALQPTVEGLSAAQS